VKRLQKIQGKERVSFSFPFFSKKSLFILAIFVFFSSAQVALILMIPAINQSLFKSQRMLIILAIKQSLLRLRV